MEKNIEDQWLVDATDENRIEDLIEKKESDLKRKKINEPRNFRGYEYEFEIWKFFLSLKPNFISDITRLCKFDFSKCTNEDAPKIDGESLSAYQSAKQTDVVAIFDRHIFIVECKATKSKKSYSSLSEQIALFNSLRPYKNERVESLYGKDKYVPVHMFCTDGYKIKPSEHIECLKKQKVILFSEKYKEYIDTVREESESGEFAYIQLLGMFRSGHPDYGEVEFDSYHSVSGKKKKHKVYTFSMSPEELLKISTVSHHRAALIYDTNNIKKSYYQRLLKKGRIAKISQWLIENESPFPNNIIVSYRGKSNLVWNPTKQKNLKKSDSSGVEANKPGTLTFDACPGTFHVVDGQHRLFSYTGVPKKEIGGLRRNHRLLVTAFEGLSAEEEANLFLEVNQNAKPINPGLIMEIQYASEEVFLDNLATAVVFEFRKNRSSALFDCINEAEGKSKQLQPKQMQSGILRMDTINASDFTSGKFWPSNGNDSWQNLLTCSEKMYEHMNTMLNDIKEKNSDVWFKKKKFGKNKEKEKSGLLQDSILQGVFFVLDRIMINIRGKEKQIECANVFAANLAAHERDDLMYRILNLKYYTAGGGAMGQIGPFLIDLFLSDDYKELQYDEDLELLRVIADSDGRGKDEMQKLDRERLREVKYTRKLGKKLPISTGTRFQRAKRYHNLIKRIIEVILTDSKYLNGDPWRTLIIPSKLDNDANFKEYLRKHETDQKKAVNMPDFPFKKIEGEDLRKVLDPFKINAARPMGAKSDESRNKIKKNLLEYIWNNLLLFRKEDVEDLPKEMPELNNRYWTKGTKYIDTFYTFRNKSYGDNLDDAHMEDSAESVEHLEDEFDEYEKGFTTKVQKIMQDFKDIQTLIEKNSQ